MAQWNWYSVAVLVSMVHDVTKRWFPLLYHYTQIKKCHNFFILSLKAHWHLQRRQWLFHFCKLKNSKWMKIILSCVFNITRLIYLPKAWWQKPWQCLGVIMISLLALVSLGSVTQKMITPTFGVLPRLYFHWQTLLAKMSSISQHNYATPTCLDFLGWRDINMIISVCVILPKVTKEKATVTIDSMIELSWHFCLQGSK